MDCQRAPTICPCVNGGRCTLGRAGTVLGDRYTDAVAGLEGPVADGWEGVRRTPGEFDYACICGEAFPTRLRRDIHVRAAKVGEAPHQVLRPPVPPPYPPPRHRLHPRRRRGRHRTVYGPARNLGNPEPPCRRLEYPGKGLGEGSYRKTTTGPPASREAEAGGPQVGLGVSFRRRREMS